MGACLCHAVLAAQHLLVAMGEVLMEQARLPMGPLAMEVPAQLRPKLMLTMLRIDHLVVSGCHMEACQSPRPPVLPVNHQLAKSMSIMRRTGLLVEWVCTLHYSRNIFFHKISLSVCYLLHV